MQALFYFLCQIDYNLAFKNSMVFLCASSVASLLKDGLLGLANP